MNMAILMLIGALVAGVFGTAMMKSPVTVFQAVVGPQWWSGQSHCRQNSV